jgi:L-fuconolactonase
MRTIIDSHIHFWNPNHLRYEWLDSVPQINKTYLPSDFREASKGWQMEKMVFVQADCVPAQGLDEAKWVTELAQDDKRIQGIVAFAPLENGDAARSTLEALAALPLVKGVRRLIQSEALGFSTQPDFIKGVQALADYNLSFDICIKHHQFTDALELVQQCPNISFVLDHIGKPSIISGLLDPWREHIKTLAGFDNVQCKISGMVTEADMQNWTPQQLQPYIDHVLECFGIGRVMYGGDYPVVELATYYARWVQTVLDAVIGLSDDEKDKLFYNNAQAFYRL